MKKTIFFQKIIDSRFFMKWEDPQTKKRFMEIELKKRIEEIEKKTEGKTEYCKNSGLFVVWNPNSEDLETDEGSMSYRVNFFITPNKETTYNTIYEIANSIWHATPFKFL